MTSDAAVHPPLARSAVASQQASATTRAVPRPTRRLMEWGYLCLVLAAGVAIRTQSDRDPIPTILAFGPRWVLALPAALFLLRFGLRPTLPIVIALTFVAVPIMGFSGAGLLLPPDIHETAETRVRILTANLGSRRLIPDELMRVLQKTHADVAVMQECSQGASDSYVRLHWSFVEDHQLCIASRLPIERVATLDRPNNAEPSAFAARYRVQLSSAVTMDVVNVHLDTPRDGFGPSLASWRGLPQVRGSIEARRQQSVRLRRWLPASGALVVAGDFNQMTDGAIYGESWSHLGNAFSLAGVGWGYTKTQFPLIRARIDHILVGPEWEVRRAWVESWRGSDHAPVIADLVLKGL